MTTTESTTADSMIDAHPEEVGMSSKALGNVTRLVQRYIDQGKYAGAISMVARHDQVVHFETYGNMDDEAARAMQPDTIVRAYSMTKPIASVALMQLYEEALFQLDDPVSAYIPELKDLKVMTGGTPDAPQVRDASREMTVRDVLMHTSGLVQRGSGSPIAELYARAGFTGHDTDFDLAEMVKRLGDIPLYCDPGSAWNYGISTDIVGYLCEVLSGQTLDRYLEERVLGPLGMVDTGFHVPESEASRLAACYTRATTPDAATGRLYTLQDAPGDSRYTRPRKFLSGAGGLVTTAADYMRFCRMLLNGGTLDGERILGSRTVEYMMMNHLPNDGDLASMGQPQFAETRMDGVGFGLGFAVLLDPTRSQTLGTPGEAYWGGAASTAFFVNPLEDLAVVFLTQLLPSSSYPIRRELRVATYQAIED
jgi:CubicO group peptidase (beta-lactamase class C family)